LQRSSHSRCISRLITTDWAVEGGRSCDINHRDKRLIVFATFLVSLVSLVARLRSFAMIAVVAMRHVVGIVVD
jgi:hypothetical protein